MSRAFLPARSLPRLHGEAFPQAVGQAARLHAGLHGDQAASAPCRPSVACDEAFGASQDGLAPVSWRVASLGSGYLM
jgi:hypothetical protein